MALLRLQPFHVPFLVATALVIRGRVFLHLDTVTLGWRQTDFSSIALNYLNNGFRFLYPQIDWGGAGPGYVEMEFPIIPYLTAALYKLFGVHDLCALAIPFLCGIGVVVAVYRLANRVHDPAVAFTSGLIVATSPLLSLASQTFLGEPALILCTVLSVHFLLRWMDSDGVSDLILSAMFTAFAVLLKLTALYIGLPLLTLFILKYGARVLRSSYFWLFGVLSLAPVLLWYIHAYTLYVEYGNTFGILAGGYNKFARLELLLDIEFYVLMAKRIALSVSSPIVLALLFFALFQRPVKPVAWALHAWTFALMIYTVLIAEGNKDMIYYQLAWLPAVAVLGSVGLFSFLDRIARLPLFVPRGRQRTALVVVLGFLVISIAGVIARSEYVPITVLESEERIRVFAEEVRRVTPEGSLIVVASSYGNEKTPSTIDTPPQMFHLSKRHGWYQALAWLTPRALDSLHVLGAEFLVVFGSDVEVFRSDSPVYQTLMPRSPVILDRYDLFVLSLRTK